MPQVAAIGRDFLCPAWQERFREFEARVRSWLDSDLTATPDLRPLYPQLRT